MEREKLSNGKCIMGAGRLTDKAISTFQDYYRMEIKNNVDDLYGMKKPVWTTLFHNCGIVNEEERHQFCSRLRTSWFMWWSDKLTPGQNKYRKKLSLPLIIKSLLMSISGDLSNETLLEKLNARMVTLKITRRQSTHLFGKSAQKMSLYLKKFWKLLLHQLLLSLMMVVMD